MSATQLIRTPIVAGFAGEDINSPAFAVPTNIAADALNTDYYRDTMRKRDGFTRLDDRMVTHGGIRSRKNGTGTNVGNISWSPAASWAIAFAVQVEHDETDDGMVIAKAGTVGASGWNIFFDKTNTRFVAQFETSGGTKTLNQASTSYPSPGKAVMLMLVYYVANNGTKYYRFYQDSTLVEDSHAADTWTSGSPVLFNASASPVCKMYLSELRFWELASANDSDYAGWLTIWTTDLGYRRELTPVEVAKSALVKLYRFRVDERITGASSGFTPTKGSGNFRISIPLGGVGAYTNESAHARNLVCPIWENEFPRVTALDFFSATQGHVWVRLGHEAVVHPNHDADSIYLDATALCEIFVGGSGRPLYEAWSIQRFRTALVAVHPYVGCFFLKNQAFTQLCLPSPSVSGVTADDSGGGTGPGAGTYAFKFYYRNSVGEITGVSSQTPVEVTMAGANAIELNGITTMFTTRRPLEGSDYVDIFRTKDAGTTFYYVDTVALSASPSDPYTSAAINVLDADIVETNSDLLLRYTLVGEGKRFFYAARAVIEHRGYLLLIAPTDSPVYDEVDLRDPWQSSIAYSEPLNLNLFATSNYREVLPDVNDFLVGGISVLGGCLLAKRYSLVAMFGESPDTWAMHPIEGGVGCISHRSIAKGEGEVFLLADDGIYSVPLPLGSGPAVNITRDRFQPLTADIDPTKLGMACGRWWKEKGQYLVTFDTLSNGRVTLVYTKKNKSLARYDLDMEAYCTIQAGDPTLSEKSLVGSYRGYLVAIDEGTNDGATVEEFAEDLVGTVTAADAYSFTDSGQAWSVSSHYASVTADSAFAILAGLKVVLTHVADDTEETREIYFNSATRAWISEAWDVTPSVGDTYKIAGINWFWKTARIAPHGDPGEKGHTLRLTLWQKIQSLTGNFQYDYTLDGTLVTPEPSNDISNAQRKRDRHMNTKATEIELRFRNNDPDLPVEIEAYRFDVEQAQPRP